MKDRDENHVTFIIPNSSPDRVHRSEYGEQNQRPTTPKPKAPPPTQRSTPPPNQTTDGKEKV